MQILNIILYIMAIIANCFLTWFAITAWFELRRLKRDIIGMKRALAVTTTITMGEHVKSNFEQLNEMKAAFHRLIENEQYEEAEKLKAAIKKDGLQKMHHVMRGLKILDRKTFQTDRTNDISDKYAVHYIPTKFLIDKEGNIVGRLDSDELDAKLAEIFGK